MTPFARFTFILLAAAALSAAAGKRVLVYTRNYTPDGKGYVHANIPASVEAIRKMGLENGFAVEHSEDPALFTVQNLTKYSAIVFSNSNNEAFSDDSQRKALESYVRAGGGVVGIHSATGSEREWPGWWDIMGGKFLRHPKMQKFTVRVKDPSHPAMKSLPATFEWEDECYYTEHMNPEMKVLLVTDPAKIDDPKKAEYPGDRFGDSLPLAWAITSHGGRTFYTALGHKPEHYSDPLLYNQILGGILWAMGGK